MLASLENYRLPFLSDRAKKADHVDQWWLRWEERAVSTGLDRPGLKESCLCCSSALQAGHSSRCNPHTVLRADTGEIEPAGLVAPRAWIGTFVTATLNDGCSCTALILAIETSVHLNTPAPRTEGPDAVGHMLVVVQQPMSFLFWRYGPS